MKFRIASGIAAGALGIVSATGAHAGPYIVPITTLGSSNYPGYEDSNAIDGSAVSDWASFGQGVGSYLRFDLGANYALGNVYATDRVTSGGPNNAYYGGLFDFTTSFTLQAFTDATFTTSVGSLFTFNKTAPSSPTSPSDFLFVGSTSGLSGRYFVYTVAGANGANPGLSDLAFLAAVPEPATWGLMLVGFGAMGGAMRYRRRKLSVSFS